MPEKDKVKESIKSLIDIAQDQLFDAREALEEVVSNELTVYN